MPKFFLNVETETGRAADPEGHEYVDLDHAIEEARLALCDLSIQDLKTKGRLCDRTVEITGNDGNPVAMVKGRASVEFIVKVNRAAAK